MHIHSLTNHAFAAAALAAANASPASCTLTLELPAAAQACSPGERPMGSVIKIEVDGKPVTSDTPAAVPLPILRPALLTLTF
jgi:hypothetical protein